MKPAKIIIIAITISLAAHAAFFALAHFIRMHGVSDMIDSTRYMFRLKDVSDMISRSDLAERSRAEISSLSIESPEEIDDSTMFKDLSSDPESLRETASEEKKQQMSGGDEDAAEISAISESVDIFEADAERIAKQVSPEKRRIDRAMVRNENITQVLTARTSPVRTAVPSDYLAQDAPSEYEPVLPGDEMAVREDAGAASVASVKKIRVGQYDDVGGLMSVKVSLYTDQDTGERYFKAEIDAIDDGELEVLPKEVTFLIDSSKSITEEKLGEMIEGVTDSLGELNPGDRFNIASFSGDMIRFSDSSVFATEKEITRAGYFLRKLTAVGQTDVENALLRIVREQAPMYPSYLVLATDGRPTKGELDSREIIREITRANGMKRPLFCFGGGKRVNKYLLDFISYQNRAWSHFSPEVWDIGADFVSFFREIKDPLLLDVRFNFAGMDAKEVYPKFLPDFFRGRPFVMYGKIGDERSFTLQLLGDIGGFTKELVYVADLSRAEKAGPEIAGEWAFMKMYYLISLDTMGSGDPGTIRGGIEALSRKYGIKTPYEISETEPR